MVFLAAYRLPEIERYGYDATPIAIISIISSRYTVPQSS
jgi:hypothetical protein